MKTEANSEKSIDTTKTKRVKLGISHNLKILMERSNISEHELSRRTNVKQPIIHRLLSGTNVNPKLLTIKPIADYFMLTVSQLIGEDEIENVWDGLTSGSHLGWKEIPLSNYQEIKHNTTQINKFILTEGNVSTSSFAFYVSDQSMEPLFPTGSIVIVDPKIIPKNGHYIIIKTHNQIILRNFISISNENYIIPLNNKFGTISKLTNEDEILGTVVRTIYDHKLT